MRLGTWRGAPPCHHSGRWTSQLLERTLAELGEPRYRAGQIWRWTAQGAAGFDAMTNLPLTLRAR